MSHGVKVDSMEEVDKVIDVVGVGMMVTKVTNELLELSIKQGHIALVEEYAKIKAEVKALRGMKSGLEVITKNKKLDSKYRDLLKDTDTQLKGVEVRNKVYSNVVGLSRVIHNIEPPKRTKKEEEKDE